MPAGRPPYAPTEADRNLVRTMAAGGMPQDIIARCIGKKGIHPETLRLHFREELDTSMALANAEAVGQLQAAIKRGEAWAVCFRLKCRAGWKETSKVEHSGDDGGPIELSDVTPRERLARRIASLAARGGTPADTQ